MTTRRHVPALDGVRGFAVLLVIWYHAQAVGAERSAVESAYHRVRGMGWSGVDLFFVLSGFLITGGLLATRGRSGYWTDFLTRRVLRLLPLYLLVVAGAVGAAWVWRGTPDADRLLESSPWLIFHGANLLIARDGFTTLPYISHLWSLAVEEQFYVLWPLVVLLVPAQRLGRVCLAIAASSFALRVGAHLAGVSAPALYVLTPLRLEGLALGGWIAAEWTSEGGQARVARALRWATPLAGVVGLAILAIEHRYRLSLPPVRTVGYVANAVLAAALLHHALVGGRFARWFEGAWIRRVGVYSYAMYLAHGIIALAVEKSGMLRATFPRGGMAVEVGYVVALVLVSFVLGHLSYVGIERHFLALKDRRASAPAPAGVSAPDGALGVFPRPSRETREPVHG